MDKNDDFGDLVKEILLEYNVKIEEKKNTGMKFVHYTNTTAAMSIIRTGCIWLRQPTLMNDKLELEYGLTCLRFAYNNHEESFRKCINDIFPDLCDEIVKSYSQIYNALWDQTYIFCLSEHPVEEDNYGRLSMWRGYGGSGTGVALVIKNSSVLGESEGLKSYAYPVIYVDHIEFEASFLKLIETLKDQELRFKELGREKTRNLILYLFKIWTLTTKHKGFKEEREWRIVYTPLFEASELIKEEVEIINGIPQLISVLPLTDDPKNEVYNLDLNSLLDRLIIGPNGFPTSVEKAFRKVLDKAKVENAKDKIIKSDIPLRV